MRFVCFSAACVETWVNIWWSLAVIEQRHAAHGKRRLPGRPHEYQPTNLSEAELLQHALRLSELEANQGHLAGALMADPPVASSEGSPQEEALERARLREEQQAEYEESLRIDRERAAEKALRQKEEEERQRQESEELESKVKQAEAEEQAKKEKMTQILQEAQQMLPPEPADVPAEPAIRSAVMPPATAQTEAGPGASIDPQLSQELPQAADEVATPAAPVTEPPHQGSQVKGSRSRLPMPKMSAARRVQIGKGSVPQSLQHIVPRSPQERDRLRRAMAQTWQLADKYSFDFETTNIVVLGQQSSGKTSWVERFLGYPFSVVDTGMATSRPAVLTIWPKRDATTEDIITVIEELPGGAKSEPETLRDVPGGESALCQLFNWCAKKNTKTPLKEKIFITIETEKCDTPKRIMDLPGVRATDGSNPEDVGVNAAIVEMVTDELKKPNSMVLCLAEARSDPLNDNMLRVLQKSQAIDDRGDLHKRLLLCLTKSDQWFGDVGSLEEVHRHLRSWRRAFFGCEPMPLGWKNMVNECLESRSQQYRKACKREAEAVQAFRKEMMLDSEEDESDGCALPEDVKYWNEKVTFKKDIVMDRSLDMDWANLHKSIQQIQHRKDEVEQKLGQLRHELESHDPAELKEEASAGAASLVDAMLGETIKFMTAVTKTLIEEEREFLASRWEYSSDAMLAASQAKRARSIDYNRTDEHAPGHFDQFYLEMLEDDNFIQCVPGFDDPLTAGAGTRRAKEFFRLLSLLFMHPDENDRIRILNCTAMNPDMPNLEDAGFYDDS
eukprot:s259_g12.t1